MRFDTSQHMKLGQQMKLAPRMIQSMEILQMPLNELEERIEQELESNVTLEVAEVEADAQRLAQERSDRERDASENERPLEVDEQSGTSDFERLDSFEESNPEIAENEYTEARPERQREDDLYNRPARNDGERDAKMDAMAAAPARSASLVEQLLNQWRLAEVADEVREPGELLLSYIEDDGYLRTPLEVIADRAPVGGGRAEGNGKPGPRVSIELLERALEELQAVLDPPGTAARDARECLLLQLDALEYDPEALQTDRAGLKTARVLVRDHLDDLMQNRLPRISERSGLSLEQIKSGVETMRRLSLAPARRLVTESPTPIIPDAIVEYDEEQDRYIAYLNDSRLPNLQVNREYAQMARDRAVPQKDREFLRTNMSNAQWLIDAVNQRKHTLLRVISVVVQAQRDFFDYGPQALKPLPMTQVADQLGIHVATVSRAVAEKYLQTPRGVVPLRKFFTGGLATDSGEDMSYDAVRAALQEVIGAEDKSKPLSDEAIVDELKKRGIEIARRTVAKYRDQLGIPSARLRKTF
jgi:RNA polymerase sigma-54 factor